MSSDPVGGYILFPSTLTRSDLIRITLKAMELGPDEFQVRLPDDGFPRFSGEGYPFRIEEPPERALALLAQEESGVIEGKGLKSAETYWFEPAVASYSVVTLWVVDTAMWYDKRPKEVDSFAKRWLQLCEQGHAVLGDFSPFAFMFERNFLEERVLPALQHRELKQLMSPDVNWLIYLGPELAERWRQEQTPFPSAPLISQDLPSGAHFFRTRTEVFA